MTPLPRKNAALSTKHYTVQNSFRVRQKGGVPGPPTRGVFSLKLLINETFSLTAPASPEIAGPQHRVADKVDLLIDVTLRHDFICAGRSGLTQGQLRNPDNPITVTSSRAPLL
jgi:hypothetical protein